MALSVGTRLKHAWNAFLNRAPTQYRDIGNGSGINPGRAKFTRGNERSIINSLFNRIAMDVAALDIKLANWIQTNGTKVLYRQVLMTA